MIASGAAWFEGAQGGWTEDCAVLVIRPFGQPPPRHRARTRAARTPYTRSRIFVRPPEIAPRRRMIGLSSRTVGLPLFVLLGVCPMFVLVPVGAFVVLP